MVCSLKGEVFLATDQDGDGWGNPETENLICNTLVEEGWVENCEDLDDSPIDSNNDGVGDICVGSRRWGNCGGSICDIPVMGAGNMPHGLTDGYMNNDEVPIFQIFQSSTSSYYCSSPIVELPFPGNIELLTNFLIGSECD